MKPYQAIFCITVLVVGMYQACAWNDRMTESNRRQLAEWRARQAEHQEIERTKQSEVIKLCLDKGGVPSVSSSYRLERCDFPRQSNHMPDTERNAAESYCIDKR